MKRFDCVISTIAVICLSSISCSNAPQSASPEVSIIQPKTIDFRDISVEELPSAFGTDSYTIIDVRTPEEIAGGMIDDAIHIDYVSTDFEDRLNELDKNENYVIYCRSGGRSGKTSEKMRKLGFRSVCNLDGGYLSYTAGN